MGQWSDDAGELGSTGGNACSQHLRVWGVQLQRVGAVPAPVNELRWDKISPGDVVLVL